MTANLLRMLAVWAGCLFISFALTALSGVKAFQALSLMLNEFAPILVFSLLFHSAGRVIGDDAPIKKYFALGILMWVSNKGLFLAYALLASPPEGEISPAVYFSLQGVHFAVVAIFAGVLLNSRLHMAFLIAALFFVLLKTNNAAIQWVWDNYVVITP